MPDRRLPPWLRPRWAMVWLSIAAVLATGVATYVYAHRREAALAWLEKERHSVTFRRLPKWYPEWAEPPRWLRSVRDVHWARMTRVDLGPLVPLPEIQRLGADDTVVDAEGLGAIGRFHNLGFVNFSGAILTDDALDALHACPRLRGLSLTGTGITDDSLRHLAGLSIQRLELDRTQITDGGLVHLAGMPLEDLNLASTEVTDAGLKHLVGLPLRSLELNETPVGDVGLNTLTPLRLHVLNLQDTQVTDAGMSHLTGHPLNNLGLSGTRVTNAGLSHLTALPLEHLNLGETDVTAEGLTTLIGLPQLRHIRVSFPEIPLRETALLQKKGLPVSIGSSRVRRAGPGPISAGGGR